jgi:rubrerythrin
MNTTAKLPLNEIHVLENCCIIEEKCAHIYRHFSKLYPDQPNVAELWNRVASEEDHHADLFRLAIRTMKSGLNDKEISCKKLNHVLTSLESIHCIVRTKQLTLAEAFELALHIEKSLAEFHIDSIVKFADTDLSKLFIRMERYDQGHLELLQNAVESMH